MSLVRQSSIPAGIRVGSITLVLVTLLVTLSQTLASNGFLLSGLAAIGSGVITAVLICFRWRWPREIFVVLLVVASLLFLGSSSAFLALWIWVLAAFVAACWVRAERTQWLYVGAATVVPSVVALIAGWPLLTTVELLVPMVAAGAIGFALRNRALLVTTVAERAALESESAALATRNLIIEERTRIARDLHDSLAQSLAIISAQADGAASVFASDPAAAAQALEIIRQTSREAQGQVRETVFALRDSPAETGATLTASIDELVARIGYSGVDVQTSFDGDFALVNDQLAAGVSSVAREALTNVLKYSASNTSANLWLVIQNETITLTVKNQIASMESDALKPGHGIVSMRERVTDLDGVFSVDRSDNSFVIIAQFPLGVSA